MSSDARECPRVTDGRNGFLRKIVTAERLREIMRDARQDDGTGSAAPTFVQCHGCFDIVHPGHIRYLQFARDQGDRLIVSITGDAAIHKGATRPYIPQELRAENLAALEFVDYVVIDPHPTAAPLLGALRPDIYVKGEEYATSSDPRFAEERRVVESCGGRVLFSSGQVVFSSTRLAETLQASEEPRRLEVICKRHEITLHRLRALMDRMSRQRVLVVGDACLERYIFCGEAAMAGEAAHLSLTALERVDQLGGAALLAAQAASLGARVTLATNFAEDEPSCVVLQRLRSLGVGLVSIQPRAELPVRSRFLVDDQKVFRVDRGAARPLDSHFERRARDVLSEVSKQADMILFLDAGYGLLTAALLQKVLPELRRRVAMLCGGSTEPLGTVSSFRDFDMIGTSERRMRMILGDPSGGLSSLAYRMMDQTQSTQLIVTMGRRGTVVFDRPTHDRKDRHWQDRLRSEYLPSPPVHVADRLGESETVLAASALALACGATLMQAAYLGEAAAAVQIGRLGTTPVDVDTVGRYLAGRPEIAGDHPLAQPGGVRCAGAPAMRTAVRDAGTHARQTAAAPEFLGV